MCDHQHTLVQDTAVPYKKKNFFLGGTVSILRIENYATKRTDTLNIQIK
jgi:hypothetical protein